MSEEGSFGVAFIERVFGFVLLAIGGLSLYYALSSAEALGKFLGFFAFLNVVVIVLGFFLMTAKTE